MAKTKKSSGNQRRGISHKGILFWSASLLLVVILGLIGFSGYAATSQPNRIAFGISISGLDVGGLDYAAAARRLHDRLAEIRLVYAIGDNRSELRMSAEDNEPKVFSYDETAALDRALNVGKKSVEWPVALERLVVAVQGKDIELPIAIDEAAFVNHLEETLGKHLTLTLDASLRLKVDSQTGQVTGEAVPEQAGLTMATGSALAATRERLASLVGGVVQVETLRQDPKIVLADIQPFVSVAAAVAGRAPLTLRASGNYWTVSRSLAASWLTVTADPDAQDGFRLGLDATAAAKYLASHADAVYRAPTDAVIKMTDAAEGQLPRVLSIVPSVDGEALDVDASVQTVETALLDPNASSYVDLPLKAVRPNLPTEKANPWGVKEIIGRGSSYFAGSPPNRLHNISVGATSLAGIVIPPGAVFSTIQTLGEISGETGYRQELVIKGDKTTPEYGGGLCQIGSTVFRTALAAGLPITERRNHSYRVSYYEYAGDGTFIGPGKDATIYDPAPDMKFMNDTGHHVILMTAMAGNTLTFTLWGVSDGRIAEQTDAVVYNRTDPPEKRLIETIDLPPGEEKCTERAHAGASAVFTYTVTYPGGEVKKKDFYSHYRPWGEVCLIGIDPSAPKIDEQAIETPATADAAGVTGE
jgi:vancomycin resistance protein YoaR